MDREYEKLAESFISALGLYEEYSVLCNEEKRRVLRLALTYMLTYDAVPERYDCGLLCSHACCRGDGGMLLLPGEEFFAKKLEGANIHNSKDGNILCCSGRCERALRPFACRIFPYYFSFSQEKRPILRRDPRSAHICPIFAKRRIRIGLIRSLMRAEEILAKDARIRQELILTSDFCDSLYELYGKIYR